MPSQLIGGCIDHVETTVGLVEKRAMRPAPATALEKSHAPRRAVTTAPALTGCRRTTTARNPSIVRFRYEHDRAHHPLRPVPRQRHLSRAAIEEPERLRRVERKLTKDLEITEASLALIDHDGREIRTHARAPHVQPPRP